ncbi:MAG: hypothetical protein VX438_07055, partial [Planctomycetota bacterium]|nr:hypothetical protein [Planctomycetota bacterium]
RPNGFELDYPASFFKRLQMQPPPREGKYTVQLESILRNQNEQEQLRVFEQIDEVLLRPWRREEFPAIARWLEHNKTPLAKIHDAVQRDRYFLPLLLTPGETEANSHFPLGIPYLPGVYLCRDISRQLCARSMLHLANANSKAAWKDLLASYKLARLVGQGPTPDETLVGYTLESMTQETVLAFIQQTRPTPQTILSYRLAIDHLPPLPQVSQKINLAARCACLEVILILSQGPQDLGSRLDLIPSAAGLANITKMLEPVLSPDWDTALRTANQWYDRTVAALKLPNYSQYQRAIRKIRDELSTYKPPSGDFLKTVQPKAKQRKIVSEIIGNLAVAIMLADEINLSRTEWLIRQQGNNLQLALALAAFRSTHDRYPNQLSELVPAYLKHIPPDIFSGKRPVYRRLKNGYHLYSVGPNQRDDGGQTGQNNPAADDLPVRTPNPNP